MTYLVKVLNSLNIDQSIDLESRLLIAIKDNPNKFFSLCEETKMFSFLFSHQHSLLIYSYFNQNFQQSHIDLIYSIIKSCSYKFYEDKFNIFSTILKFDLNDKQFYFLLDTYVSFFLAHYQSKSQFLQNNFAMLPTKFQSKALFILKQKTKDQLLIDFLETYIKIYHF